MATLIGAKLRTRLRGDSGAAMIVTILSLMLLLSLSAVALSQAMATGSSSVRDQGSKGALQAADAGVDIAKFRASKTAAACTDATGAVTTPQTIAGVSWCPEVSEQLDGNRSYRYRMTANTFGDRTVMGIGGSGGATRRVRATIKRTSLPGLAMGVTALDSITMSGGSAVFNTPAGVLPGGPFGDVGTNGDFNVSGSAQTQFRNVLLGPGGTVSSGVSSTRQVAVPPFVLPLPDFEGPENTNDNGLIPLGTPGWDPATRDINISNTPIELDSGTYDFCRIRISNGGLYVKPGAHATIYLDSPDRNSASPNPQTSCGNAADSGTINVSGSGSIQACSAISGVTCTTGNPADLLIVMYGRPSFGKDARVSGGSAKTAVFYAPRTNFDLSGSGKTIGSVAVKTANFSGGSQIWYDDRAASAGSSGYARSTWLECRPAPPTSDPASGC